MKISSDSNTLKLLPSNGRHLLIGIFDQEIEGKTITTFFNKHEEFGLSKPADVFNHAANYIEHSKTNKAFKGARETFFSKTNLNGLLDRIQTQLDIELSTDFRARILATSSDEIPVSQIFSKLKDEGISKEKINELRNSFDSFTLRLGPEDIINPKELGSDPKNLIIQAPRQGLERQKNVDLSSSRRRIFDDSLEVSPPSSPHNLGNKALAPSDSPRGVDNFETIIKRSARKK